MLPSGIIAFQKAGASGVIYKGLDIAKKGSIVNSIGSNVGAGYRKPLPKISFWDYAVAPIYPQFLTNKLFTITTAPGKGLIDSAKKAKIESGGDETKYWDAYKKWEKENMKITIDVPKIPGLPDIPGFPGIDWDKLRNALLLGAVAIGGLFLLGKYIGKK